MAAALRWLAFVVGVALLVPGPFSRTFVDSQRYGYLADIMPSDWVPTNIWLDSTDCAMEHGVWLALCDEDWLVPISEHSIGDDPGHALVLDVWSMATDRRATLVDVARLNTILNAVGLVALAGLLFGLRAWLTAAVLIAFGPIEYFGWMGTSPHWSFIGIVSMAAVLPIALGAAMRGLLPRGWGVAWIATGLVFLAFATLVREAIGIMGLLVSLATVASLAPWRRPSGTRVTLGMVSLLAVMAFLAPKWVVMARDAMFDMAPAERVQSHGLAHTLYIGLGFVENKFGIRYDDAYAEALAAKVAPEMKFGSPEYYGLMGRLYFERIAEDPVEVARIYLAKARLLLTAPTLQPGPPFGAILAVGVVHWLAATLLGAWQRIGFRQGGVIEAVTLGFMMLFLAQAMVALPSHMYAVPVNAFVLVLAGLVLEFACRGAWTFAGSRRHRMVPSPQAST